MYEARGYYRPQRDCIMFTRDEVGFCAVCRRAIERVMGYTRERVDEGTAEQTAAAAARYLEGLETRAVLPRRGRRTYGGFGRAAAGGALQRRGGAGAARRLRVAGIGATAGGRFFGYVHGGTLRRRSRPTGWPRLGIRTRPWPHQPGDALEEIGLGWLLDVLRLPAGSAGAFVTGATMANFSGLAAARHAVLERAGWDVEATVCTARPPSRWWPARRPPLGNQGLGLLGLGGAT